VRRSNCVVYCALFTVCFICPVQAGVVISFETTTKTAELVTSQSWDTLFLTENAMRNNDVKWIPGTFASFSLDTGTQRTASIAHYDAPTMWRLYPDSGQYYELDVILPKVDSQKPAPDERPLIEFGRKDLPKVEWRHAVDESAAGQRGDDSCNSVLFLSLGRTEQNGISQIVFYEVCLSSSVPGLRQYQSYQQWDSDRNAANGVWAYESQGFDGAMIQQYKQLAQRVVRGDGIPLKSTSLLMYPSSDTVPSPILDSLYELMDPQHFNPIRNLATVFRSLSGAGEFETLMETKREVTSITEKEFDLARFSVPADYQQK